MSANPSSIMQLLQGVFPFSDLDQKTLSQVAPLLEKNSYPAGVELYEDQQESDALYFILVGEVEIIHEDKKGKRTLSILKAGDHFGEDSLTGFHRYQTSAITRSRVILARISRENIAMVGEISPTLRRLFTLLRRTYQLQLKLHFQWHKTSETIYLISRRHPIFLWLRLIPILLVTLACFGGLLFVAFSSKSDAALWLVLASLELAVGLLLGAWVALDWTNDYFILTRDRVLIQKLTIGFYDSRQETPMSAILSTGMDATFFGRVFGFGAVTARAYTGDLRLNKLPDPDLILAFLEHRRKSLQAEQRREEQHNMHSMLQNRLQPEQARITQPVPVHREEQVHVNYYTGTFSDLLARFFGLRMEKEGAIIYRTHWWILFKRTFFPVLFLLLVLGFALARFAGAFTLNESLVYLIAIIFTIFGWCWWLYNYIDWRNDVYIISGDQLMDVNRRPLGSEEKRSAPVKNIQTVEFKRNGIIALTLNFGTVRIQIGNEELTFDNVYNPSVVQIEIFEHMRQYNEQTRKLEQKRMVDWISTYDGIRKTEKQEPKGEIDQEKE
jgi:CRP-like cAMP-binding protein